MIKNLLFGVLLPLLLVGAGIGVFIGLQAPTPPQTPVPKPVAEELLPYIPRAEVARVQALSDSSDSLQIHVSGTVVPYRELQIAAEVAGRIIEKDPGTRSGNYVKKGQVLYRIDPSDYELEVERLTRRREQELAFLTELDQDIANTEALMKVADEELLLAEADVKRIEGLKSNFSSAKELDDARRARLNSLNQRVTLQNQIRTFRARRSRLELAAQLAETELKQARLNLDRTMVRAPVDGKVVSEQIEVDSYVQRGALLAIVEDTEKVEIACNLRMSQLQWILDQPEISADQIVNAARAARQNLPNTPATIQFEVSDGDSSVYEWRGVLDRFDGAGLDLQSRTVPIRLRVDDPSQSTTSSGKSVKMNGPPMLVRGMFVNVVIEAKPTSPLMLVPKLSIKPASGTNVIWKFSPDEEALFATPIAIQSLAQEKDQPEQNPAESSGEETDKKKVNPAEWETGFLEVVSDVRMVASYWDNDEIDYWVCSVPPDQLAPGDRVIITPLPGIKADGTDPVRIKKPQPPQSASVAEVEGKDGQS